MIEMTVWHNNNFLKYAFDNYTTMSQYRVLGQTSAVKVAEVKSDCLAQAYELTNNIDRPWTENSGVRSFGDGRSIRSTSVGDIIYTPSETSNLEREGYYVVENFGFRWISNPVELKKITFLQALV